MSANQVCSNTLELGELVPMPTGPLVGHGLEFGANVAVFAKIKIPPNKYAKADDSTWRGHKLLHRKVLNEKGETVKKRVSSASAPGWERNPLNGLGFSNGGVKDDADLS